MELFEIKDGRFANYILRNAGLEQLATGFRWLEGPVWFGDANCLLFQDLPSNRTMRWAEASGVCVYRYPSDYANGQTRDRLLRESISRPDERRTVSNRRRHVS